MRLRLAGVLLLPLAMVMAWASPAAAQWRVHPPLYPYPYGYYGRYYEPEADVRLDIKPKQAAVYVDGYFAGQVDDFDGLFQRLHVTPGEHEIVVYLQGYRALHEKLYLGPNTSRKIEARLAPLGPGEANEPIPVPAPPPEGAQPMPMPRPMPRGGPGRFSPPPPPPPPQPDNGPDAGAAGNPPAGRPSGPDGTLVLRVSPTGADVLIDGQHWNSPTIPMSASSSSSRPGITSSRCTRTATAISARRSMSRRAERAASTPA